jgi:hypothetical protein
MEPKYDYIIIGGGLAGLYTAYKINQSEPKAKLLILERNRQMGGRIDTINHKLEAGAGRFHDHHKLLLTLIDELGLTNKIQPISSFEHFAPINSGKIYDWKPIDAITTKISKPPLHQIPNDQTFLQYARTQLTKDEIDLLTNFFGYSTELTEMNARDSIGLMKRHFNKSRQYYVMNGGLSQITERLIERIDAQMLTHRRVINITGTAVPRTPPATEEPNENGGRITSHNKKPNENGGRMGGSDVVATPAKLESPIIIECEGIKQKYTTKKCICALTKDTLLRLPIFEPIYPMLHKIQTLPLCRIYSQVPDLPQIKITTNNNLRIIIPIDEKTNTVMMSYTDNNYARFWKKMLDEKGMDAVNKEHKRLLEQTLNHEVQMPKKTQVFYWEHGVAYFSPGFDSKTMPKQIMHPFRYIPLYVCGENYSEKNNQWMEGALDTSEYILKLL